MKKHRNDVFRLLVTLAPTDRFELPAAIRAHLAEFVAHLPPASREWAFIRQAVTQGPLRMPEPEAAILQLRTNFGLA